MSNPTAQLRATHGPDVRAKTLAARAAAAAARSTVPHVGELLPMTFAEACAAAKPEHSHTACGDPEPLVFPADYFEHFTTRKSTLTLHLNKYHGLAWLSRSAPDCDSEEMSFGDSIMVWGERLYFVSEVLLYKDNGKIVISHKLVDEAYRCAYVPAKRFLYNVDHGEGSADECCDSDDEFRCKRGHDDTDESEEEGEDESVAKEAKRDE